MIPDIMPSHIPNVPEHVDCIRTQEYHHYDSKHVNKQGPTVGTHMQQHECISANKTPVEQ